MGKLPQKQQWRRGGHRQPRLVATINKHILFITLSFSFGAAG